MPPAAPEPTVAAPTGSAVPAGPRLGRIDLAVLGLVAALLVFWLPFLYLATLTPRMALALALVGPGLVVVVALARRGDLGARVLGAFVAWTLLCALLAAHPRLSLLGGYGTDSGWIWTASFAAAWGLGRRLSPLGARFVPRVLVAGLAANALVGVLEAILEPGGDLATAEGRVAGLVSNSVFFAGLMCGGLALLGRLSASPGGRRATALGLMVLFACATNLSGSRTALLAGAVLAVAGAAVGARVRDRTGSLAPVAVAAGLAAVAVVVGFACSVPLEGATSSSTRIGEVSADTGVSSRLLAWRMGLDAVAERPVVGWGPGRFGEATTPRATAAFVRAESPDRFFHDAHNLLVEHLVTSGVVGVALLLAFGALAVGRARGPAAWFVLGVTVTWMLNPASTTTAPVALIALGAAWRREPAGAPAPAPLRIGSIRVGRLVGAVAGALGVLAGGVLIAADAYVDQGTITGDLATVERAQRLLPGEATITGLVTDARFNALQTGGRTPEAERAVIASAERATREDPTRSTWWVRLAYAEGTFGDGTRAEQLAAADRDVDRALERSPWSVEAMTAKYNLAGLTGDEAEVARWRDRLCEVEACPVAPAPDRDPELGGG